MQALEVGQRPCTIGQRIGTGTHEGRAQQEVFGRVAAEAELGGDDQAHPLRMRPSRRLDDAAAVSRQIPHGRVDLRQGHFQRELG